MEKALVDIPIGKQIGNSPPKEQWSPITTNNFAQMTGRSSKGWKGYDYSHILKPELKEKGYSLTIHHDNPRENIGDKRFYKKALVATVKHKGQKIGNTVGYLHDNGDLELATEFASHISPLHRGKGLGVAMYEGIMSHAKNALDGKQVVGGVHSTMASKVHSALAKKHGLDYLPTANQNSKEYDLNKPVGEYDDKLAPYSYMLKAEELNKALADIPIGEKLSNNKYDYSHVLKPEHKQEGYSINVLNDNGKLFSVLNHNGKAVGNVYGSHNDSNTLDLSSGFASHISPEHQNKGLGKAMYEALLAHAHNDMGIDKIVGGKHSTSASRVHSALSAKHGLDYKPELNEEASMSDEEYNDKMPKGLSAFTSNVKFGPYSYTLKSELIDHTKNIVELFKSLNKSSVEDTMHEFKEGTLRSGSKDGPKVTDRNQAIAIALNQSGESTKKSEHIWRNRPILKAKDAEELDQNTAAQALKLGDIKRAEEAVYNDYQRNHRLNAAAHHYKALGEALAKGHRNASDHHRLAYQGHMQALGLNGLESPPRVIMERIRQITDKEPTRFKSHPADIFSI